MNMYDIKNKTLFSLEEIHEYEEVGFHNMHDISVDGDESFTLANGVVSHNSAGATLIEVRDPKKAGFMPLRGVVKNVWTDTPNETLKNKEISELIAVLGLVITDKESYKNMHYQNVAILSDADVDGGKIATLIVAFFYKYWPGFVAEGRLKIARSPILIATKGKETKWFYSLSDAEDLKKQGGWHFRYIKGLASLKKDEYDKIINTPVFDVVKVSDPSLLEMMFGDESQLRKEFMFR